MREDEVAARAAEWAELLSDIGGFCTDYDGLRDLTLCRRAAHQAGELLQRSVKITAQDGIVSIWLPDWRDNPPEARTESNMSGQANTVIQGRDFHGAVTIHQHEAESAEPASDQPPIIVTAETRYSNLISRQLYYDLVNISPSQLLTSGYSHEQLMSNYREMTRGITDNNGLLLTVEGRAARAVILERLRVRTLDRRTGSIPRGILVRTRSAPYAMKVSSFLADLRAGDTVVPTPLPEQHDLGRLTPDFPYVVHRAEPERLNIHLYYGDEDIEWFAELDWTSGGRSGTFRIDNDGVPFISTPFCTRPAYKWDDANKRWQPDEDVWPEWMQQWIDRYSRRRS